jgi:2-polyprenyl-3-methyl-5-hydroxy-6-metoxy-1,4-benzoquinol methylase
MKKDTMPQVARFWNDIAVEFDSIYTGNKTPVGRALDKWLRRDMYQRFDWVMETCGDVQGKQICDVGCGSGRFATELARRGASVTGIDVAPEMLRLARSLAITEGVSDSCEFVHSDVLDWTAPRAYDTTIAIGFWDYIMDPRERLRRIRSFTSGTFLSAWPRMWTWRMPIRKVRLQVRGCPVYFFRQPQVYSLLRETGFEVRSCKTIGKLFCVDARPI